ncbi:TonB-dependent receptor, partial [Myxococcota bacterium]|nr:TonB-dependent receptor [Myxococcota bacterium]
DKLKLILAGSTEDINLDFGVHIAFHRLMIRDRWAINDHTTLTSTFSPGVQTTGFDQSSEEIGLDANFNLDIWGIDWREDFETKINSWMDFRAGLDLRMGYADLNLEFPFVASLRRFPSQVMDLSQTSKYTDEMKVYNHAYWVETQIEPTEGLKIIPGLRFDRWDFHHTQDYSIQPRLAVRYQLNEEATIKGAYGLFEKLPEPNYLMTNIGNPNLSPIRSQHFIGGLEYAFTPLINLDLQVYYNQRTRLPAPSSDVALQDGDVLPQIWDNGGTGSSYGVEVLLRHLATADGNFYGWLAYTLSRSAEREHSPGATYDVALADGTVDTYAYSDKETELHLSEFDQTHILTLVGQWILPWGLEAGFRFRLVSGNPYNPRDEGRIYYDADTDSYGVDMTDVERNSSRMPTFNQLDLRIDKTWVMDIWKLTAFLEVINAYNAKNVEQ